MSFSYGDTDLVWCCGYGMFLFLRITHVVYMKALCL